MKEFLEICARERRRLLQIAEARFKIRCSCHADLFGSEMHNNFFSGLNNSEVKTFVDVATRDNNVIKMRALVLIIAV